MFRLRRYRVFVIFAITLIAAIYRFTTVQEWEAASASSLQKLKSYAGQSYKGKTPQAPEALGIPQEKIQPATTPLEAKVEAAIPDATAKPIGDWELGLPNTTPKKVLAKPTLPAAPATTTTQPPGKLFQLAGQGRLDAPEPLKDLPTIHWEAMPQHFPVPKQSIIALPTGTPKTMPKIQYVFKDETSAEKTDREKKQGAIRAAFQLSWDGYKQYAWLHDELRPTSGKARDPFCGWAATLVDALDTLWIMGLKKEFEEAVEAVGNIDFTTTTRTDIPLFETVIRYLGGLLAAYDVSGAKHKVLLTKAQELGDVLFSAFDTPNRMPITYYNWRPTFAKNPHRAGTRTSLAELGSLVMEFTRLAQLTGEDKYYDAVARITNELELMQGKTRVPGLWPDKIDTSGCQKPAAPLPQEAMQQQAIANAARAKVEAVDEESEPVTDNAAENTNSDNLAPRDLDSENLVRRQLYPDKTEVAEVKKGVSAASDPVANGDGAEVNKPEVKSADSPNPDQPAIRPAGSAALAGPPAKAWKSPDGGRRIALDKTEPPATLKEKVDCLAQGLTSPPNSFMETFKFGGGADSTYEYFPKMHMLLGGLTSQYSKMYSTAMDAVSKHLLIRQMIPDENRELLLIGSADVNEGWEEHPEGNFTLNAKQSHLLCFSGGMYGIGSRLFGRPEDFEIAKKITDGCVWAYENTATGIMPEEMDVLPCKSLTSCPWNETLWKDTIDPYWEQREESRLQHQAEMKKYEAQLAAEANSKDMTSSGDMKLQNDPLPGSGNDASAGHIAKRQVLEAPVIQVATTTTATTTATTSAAAEETEAYNPYPTHEEYVKQRIKQGRLPVGVPTIGRREYILRPEAIESVFIMFRMTGDESWRKKGWKMWQAIERETKTTYGYSAIHDVTRKGSEANKDDKMESFWLAETLKYFYLLYSTPDTLSLDEWVLNTEAHPFKRPS